MKVKKNGKRYNVDFSTLKSYQLFDDSESRYVHYGSRLRKKRPEQFSLKWEKVTCPCCLAHHREQEKRARIAAKQETKKKLTRK